MEYKDLLKSYIENSGLSLREIEEAMREKGFSTNKAYISKLQNGIHPPAGEDITRALAEVTGGDSEALLLAGYIEKAPEEIKPLLAEASRTGQLFSFFGYLVLFLEEYRSTGQISEEYLDNIEASKNLFIQKYNFFLQTSTLRDYPEYAVELIIRLKQHFMPLADSISYGGGIIDFSNYIDKHGKPIFKSSPYSELNRDIELYVSQQDLEKDLLNISEVKQHTHELQKKLEFFRYLENELKLDLNDPEVQKKLKRAAKIIFSEED
ncbi:helix-turn-helix domain-containing protein [Paenibacillus massiliensis]|uniref:helix-turn-helix domain-containing protein n=1 Tax=Paenibacillus massiliensis TaxID=225917 RepID=UPI0003F7C0BF|nr:helix-turn-helix domain-containing protein [Paenibacillus massiliensis]